MADRLDALKIYKQEKMIENSVRAYAYEKKAAQEICQYVELQRTLSVPSNAEPRQLSYLAETVLQGVITELNMLGFEQSYLYVQKRYYDALYEDIISMAIGNILSCKDSVYNTLHNTLEKGTPSRKIVIYRIQDYLSEANFSPTDLAMTSSNQSFMKYKAWESQVEYFLLTALNAIYADRFRTATPLKKADPASNDDDREGIWKNLQGQKEFLERLISELRGN